jgi:hypothetical protein
MAAIVRNGTIQKGFCKHMVRSLTAVGIALMIISRKRK